MALRPKQVVVNYFKNLIMAYGNKSFSLISSNMLSFFVRKNTLSEASKVYKLESYMNDVPSHTNRVVTEFVTATVNKYYPQYRKDRNVLKLYNNINNELKENFNNAIIYAAYNLAYKHRLILKSGSEFLNILNTGTYNTWVKNEAYNTTGNDPKPDYMLINNEKTTNTSVPPAGITIPNSLNTIEKGVYYMINSDPTEIMFLSTETVSRWETY
jgi:hypothetical protein